MEPGSFVYKAQIMAESEARMKLDPEQVTEAGNGMCAASNKVMRISRTSTSLSDNSVRSLMHQV